MSKKRKSHVTLPRSYDPGPGYPRETLAYLSDAEHELIRQLTDGKWNRGPKGVKSYADDSASSKGVSRGDKSGTKGNGGLGQGGQGGGRSPGGGGSRGPGGPSGPNSGPSRSSSSGSSTGGGNKSSPAGAGRDSSRGLGQGAGGQAIGRGGVSSTAGGKAADVARANAARTSLTAGNGSYYGPKGGTSLNTDARMAAARSVGFNPPTITRTPGDAEMLGRMMMAESGSIRNKYGNVNTTGLQGVADVVRNRMVSERFPNTVPGVLTQRKQFSPIADGSFARTPANPMATRVAESVLSGESPPVVGNALNYANLHTVNNLDGYSSAKTRAAFNSMDPVAVVADARNPLSRSHTFGTIGNNSDVAFNGPGTYNPGTQVAGIANAGIGEAERIARAQKARAGLDAIQKGAAPLRSAAGTYTDPYSPEVQGPVRYGGPLDKIPSPNSIGMMAPPSAFAQDPRLSVPQGAFPARAQSTVAGDPRLSQTPLGGFPAARQPSQVSTDPRVAQTPVGAFPAASRPASVFAGDPRISTTPLGSLPAAKPKEIKLAWDVPPLGGALPGQSAYGLGLWGTNRPIPKGPAAQPGTIHSQTAQATSAPATTDSAPSVWESGANWIKAKTDEVQTQIDAAKETPAFKFAQKHPRIAEFALKMMMGGGGAGAGQNFGNPQDRSGFGNRPQFMQPQAQQMAQAPQNDLSTDPLTVLNDLKANMIAKGASPEQIAYVQSIIDELSNSQVA